MKTNKRKIITTNKEIYDKFNMLSFSSEVVLKDVKKSQIDRILKSINKTSKILSFKNIGNYTIIKKNSPLNYNIYLRQK